MPPKPRPVRKPSSAAAKSPTKPVAALTAPTEKAKAEAAASAAAAAMPPPPQPQPPKAILEAEFEGLSECLKAATLKTAQIYAFHADARRLKLPQARHPPRSLTMALGHEVEKYDQLCDALESQLHRAIAVLQRDLTREEQRIKSKATAVSSRTRSKTPTSSPTAFRIPLPPIPTTSSPAPSESGAKMDSLSMLPPDGSPVQATVGDQISPPIPQHRRASVISLGTLQRPFPLKLDLSSSALRIGADEFIHPLASPVTLAPRSARPTGGELGDLPPDFMSIVGPPTSGVPNLPSGHMPGGNAGIDIDLTMSDPNPAEIDLTMPSPPPGGASTLGSSADKPIELDLDMDLFGDEVPADDMPAPPPAAEDQDILQSLAGVGAAADGEDIFGSLATVGEDSAMANVQSEAGPSGSAALPDFGGQEAAGPSEGQDHTQFDLANLDLDPNFFDGAAMSDVEGMSVDDILKMNGVSEDVPTT